MFRLFLKRELLIFRRGGGDLSILLGFFLLSVSLFAIVLGSEAELLRRVAGAVIWVLLLFSVVLVQERIFVADRRSGFLADIIVRDLLLYYLWAKIIGFYVMLCLPLIAVLPLVFVLLGLDLGFFWGVSLFIALGLGCLCLSVVLGSCLVLGFRLGHLLLPLLVLPLGLPVLLFGYAGVEGILSGWFSVEVFLFLAGYFLLNLVLCPFFCLLLLRRFS